jgi:uncharacterized protein YeaO (DUF488 family)
LRDPGSFWAEKAEHLDWFNSPTRIRDVSYGPGDVRSVVQRQNADRLASLGAVKRTGTGTTRRAVVVKRAREAASTDDGMRVLVDRLWPRGLTKERVAADLWLREVAPSDALRRWFAHEPSRWIAFSHKYRAELARRPDLLRLLDDLRRSARLTLVYNASDAEHNHAVVLQQLLSERGFTSPRNRRS